MLERLLIAGSGGQGVVLAGRLLATVAIHHAPHVTYFPSYGAEVRGGTSNCQLVLASGEIASPVCDVFDSQILMNEASVLRFRTQSAPGGLVIVNAPARDSFAVPEAALVVDATGIANRLGDTRVANFLLLGAYIAQRGLIPPPELEAEMERRLAAKSRRLFELNLTAFRTGLTLGAKA